MASRLVRRLAFRELEAVVPGLARVEVAVGNSSAIPGTTATRSFVRKCLPVLRYHNPETAFTVIPAEPTTESKAASSISLKFADGREKQIDPSKYTDNELLCEIAGFPTPAAGLRADAAAGADAAAPEPVDPRVAAVLKLAAPPQRGAGMSQQGNAKRKARKQAHAARMLRLKGGAAAV